MPPPYLMRNPVYITKPGRWNDYGDIKYEICVISASILSHPVTRSAPFSIEN